MAGQVLPLVITVLVVVVVVAVAVMIGLRARAGRRRREQAVADAEAHVVETPPAAAKAEPEPAATSSSGPPPTDHGEPLNGPNAERRRSAGVAEERREAGAGATAGGERRMTKPPAAGADSALAGLDAGRFTSSLSPAVGRGRPVIPSPSPPADDAAAEDTKAEPPYPGAAPARPDGSSPSSEYPIKANLAAKRYYTDDSPYFARTTAQVWFRSVEDAERAGFTAAR